MRYFLLICSFVVILSSCSFFGPRIEWKVQGELPNKYRNSSAVEHKGKIYFMGGYCNYTPAAYEISNYEFSPETNKWITKADMLTGRSNFALVSNTEFIYAIGGDPFSNRNERYNPIDDTWNTLEPLPTPRQHINGIIVNNKIYIIGGLINFQGSSDFSSWTFNNVTDKNEVYDIEEKTWTELAPMPTRRHNVYLAALGNKILAFGGMGVENDMWKSHDTVEEYDIDKNEWTTRKNMPMPLDGFGIHLYNGKVYIIGGFSDSVVVNTVYIYDIEKDSWSKSNNFPNNENGGSACAGNGNEFYIIGGSDSYFTAISNNYKGVIK